MLHQARSHLPKVWIEVNVYKVCRCQRQLPHNHVRHARHCSQLLGITCLSLARIQANSIQLKLMVEQLSQKSALVVDALLVLY